MSESNAAPDHHGSGHPSRPGIMTYVLLAGAVTGAILIVHWEKVSNLLP
jgi:hypothetical protein